jgi:two-component SAPR family response regulator
VADYLQESGIPFVFVTGYGADSINARFAGIPVVQKPVDRDSLKRALLGKPEQVAEAPVIRSRAAAG